jgi:hypothetical protein
MNPKSRQTPYLIVVGFSMFKTDKYYNNLYYKVIPSVVVLSIISILLLNFIKLLRTNQL